MLQALVFHSSAQRYTRALRRIVPSAIMDAFILLAAFALTYSVRTGSPFFDSTETFIYILFSIGLTLISLYIWGVYSRIWSRSSGHEISVLVYGVATALVSVLVIDLMVNPRHIPLSVVFVSYSLALMGFASVRYRSRLISGMNWRWRAVWYNEFPDRQIRVLIVGAGEAGQITAWRLKHRYQNGKNGHHVVGFVDDDPLKHHMYVEGSPIFGACSTIPEITARHQVDLIVFAIHNISGTRFREILTLCEQTPARIKIVPDILELLKNIDHAPMLRDVEAEDLLGRQPINWHEAVDATPVTEKVVLITGAAGSIGSELCKQMLKYRPVRLIMLDNNESGLHDLCVDLRNNHPDRQIVAVLADITNRERLNTIFAKYRPQLVYHAAAYKHVPLLEDFPSEAIRVNVGGSLNVMEIAQAHGVERFVLISTDKAVNPSSVMGASKRICELLTQALSQAQRNKTTFVSVRFGNVLGSRGSVVPIFNRQIEVGGPVTVTDRNMVRFFMSIPEAVNLVIQAACLTNGDDLFMLRMGEQVPIIELAERMIRLRGLRPGVDIPIEITGVRPGEKLAEELHTDFEVTHTTIHPDIVRLNGTKACWQPQMFVEDVKQLLDQPSDNHEVVLQELKQLAHSVRHEATVAEPC